MMEQDKYLTVAAITKYIEKKVWSRSLHEASFCAW